MIESIGTQLVSLLADIIPLDLSEAETNEYPYATYDHLVTEHRDKDGVYKVTSDTTLHVVGNDYSVVKSKADSIKTTLASSMRTSQYVATLRDIRRNCEEGIWVIDLYYTIVQLY